MIIREGNGNRKNEVVGAGFFVFRRGRTSRRLKFTAARGTSNSVWLPFEHASYEHAMAEAQRLAALHPGFKFCVFQQVGEAVVAAAPIAADSGMKKSADAGAIHG